VVQQFSSNALPRDELHGSAADLLKPPPDCFTPGVSCVFVDFMVQSYEEEVGESGACFLWQLECLSEKPRSIVSPPE
jgi:hypothetical protein